MPVANHIWKLGEAIPQEVIVAGTIAAFTVIAGLLMIWFALRRDLVAAWAFQSPYCDWDLHPEPSSAPAGSGTKA